MTLARPCPKPCTGFAVRVLNLGVAMGCLFVSPQNAHVEILLPTVMVARRLELSCHDWCPDEKGQRESAALSCCPESLQEEDGRPQAGRGPPPDPRCAGTWPSDAQPQG